MTDKELKEGISKERVICKDAERTILDMRVTLQKYKGDKTKQTKHLQNLDNLLNLCVKQGVEIQTYEDLLAQYLMKIGEINSKLKTMQRHYAISEKIHEVGVNQVVEEYLTKVTKNVSK